MARPMCMSEDGKQAVFVGTMLEDGQGVTLCDECLVGFASAILATMTGVDPTPFLAAISDPETVPEQPPSPEPEPEDDGDQEDGTPPLRPENGGRTHSGYPGPPTVTGNGVSDSPPGPKRKARIPN